MSLERINTIMLWLAVALILLFVIGGSYGWGKDAASLIVGFWAAMFTGGAALAAAYSAKMADKSANQWKDIKRTEEISNNTVKMILACKEMSLHTNSGFRKLNTLGLAKNNQDLSDEFSKEAKAAVEDVFRNVASCFDSEMTEVDVFVSLVSIIVGRDSEESNKLAKSFNAVKHTYREFAISSIKIAKGFTLTDGDVRRFIGSQTVISKQKHSRYPLADKDENELCVSEKNVIEIQGKLLRLRDAVSKLREVAEIIYECHT